MEMFDTIAISDEYEDDMLNAAMRVRIKAMLVEAFPTMIKECWEKRRQEIMHQLNIIEINMNYDLNRFGVIN